MTNILLVTIIALTGCIFVLVFIYQQHRLRSRPKYHLASTQASRDFRSEFVANVSHELRTPLTSISGYLETVLDTENLEKEQQRNFLLRMQRNVDRLKTLVDDLMILSELEAHPDAIARQWVSFNEIMDPVVESITPKLKSKYQTLSVENKAGSVFIDPFRIEQVIRNLVENAHRYSGFGCKIEIAAEKHDNIFTIVIKDNGIGIEAEHLPRLFERFYRVDKARSREMGGSGLGLAICKHIITGHKGTIDVVSLLGQGTEFKIAIPLSQLALEPQPAEVL